MLEIRSGLTRLTARKYFEEFWSQWKLRKSR